MFCLTLIGMKSAVKADFILYPKDEFEKEHSRECEEANESNMAVRNYTVSGEGVNSYVSPENENVVNLLIKGSEHTIYFVYKEKKSDQLWGCLDAGEWVKMDQMVLKYDNISFMEEHAAEIKDTDSSLQVIPQVNGYDLKSIAQMAEYPGGEPYSYVWGGNLNFNKNSEGYYTTVMPKKLYEDKDGKLWGYIDAYNTGYIKGWYCISDLPKSAVRDYDGDGKITLTDVQLCLKAALRIGDSRITADTGCDYSLDDAQMLLKYALKISMW